MTGDHVFENVISKLMPDGLANIFFLNHVFENVISKSMPDGLANNGEILNSSRTWTRKPSER